MFLTNLNKPFTPNRLTQLVRDYAKASGIGKDGACRLLRHIRATPMRYNGADVCFIQQLLVHADQSTTQIYTQVALVALPLQTGNFMNLIKSLFALHLSSPSLQSDSVSGESGSTNYMSHFPQAMSVTKYFNEAGF